MLAINLKFDLKELVCGTCGVVHAIPEAMYDAAAREGGWWHCPNGHKRGWHEGSEKTEINKLRRELDAERARKAEALSRANEAALAREKAQKALDRHKKRTKNGVCPCCNRSFVALARHIKNKHPEYANAQ